MPPTLVLDLDGTLVDTLPDLLDSLNRLMTAHRLAPFAPDEVARMVGDGAAALVERALTARGRPMTHSDLTAFLADYGAHAADRSALYPDVAETLHAARDAGWRLAVCTNKPEAPARFLLDHLGIAALFDAVGGGDSFPTRKPDPAHLLATIAAAGGDPADAVMVGDHRNDMEAATAAGIPSIFARWGYGTPDMATGPAADRFADVLDLADRAFKAGRYTSSHPRTTASGS